MAQTLGAREARLADDGPRRKVWVVGGVVLFAALVVGALIGDRGFLYLLEQQRRSEELRQDLEGLREENRRLAEEIAALRSDPRAIERIAREELGLALPGETVFILREERSASRP
jgi:cell division protein FtsB